MDILITLIVLVLIFIFLYIKITNVPFLVEPEEGVSIEELIKYVREYIEKFQQTKIEDLNLSQEDYEKIKMQQSEIRSIKKNCIYGDKSTWIIHG